jgi:hypothetical protein
MTTERTTPDMLTVAYIAMGAKEYMTTLEFDRRTTDSHGGELEFIDSIIGHAQMLDSKADVVDEHFTGVFLYEVAETFGWHVAQMYACDGDAPSEIVEALADRLIAANCT